jgi:hypothetical protein
VVAERLCGSGLHRLIDPYPVTILDARPGVVCVSVAMEIQPLTRPRASGLWLLPLTRCWDRRQSSRTSMILGTETCRQEKL